MIVHTWHDLPWQAVNACSIEAFLVPLGRHAYGNDPNPHQHGHRERALHLPNVRSFKSPRELEVHTGPIEGRDIRVMVFNDFIEHNTVSTTIFDAPEQAVKESDVGWKEKV